MAPNHQLYHRAPEFRLMLPEALRRAAEILERGTREVNPGVPEFGDPRYLPVPFEASGFHAIPETEPSSCVGYVDGGNQEIFHSPDLSVQLVRVCSVLFRGGERVRERVLPAIVEFVNVARAGVEGEDISYSAELIPLAPSFEPFLPESRSLVFSSCDSTLTNRGFRADISVVGAAARRFAEWVVLSKIIEEELRPGDIAVRDGTLQTAVRNEASSARRAFEAALERGVTLAALAKTSTLFTSTGMSLMAAIEELSHSCGVGSECWYYHPIVQNNHPEHRAEIFACRLHKSSKHVFRAEILREQARNMSTAEVSRVFAELRGGSRDLSFPGYPYGLVEANRMARVARGEAEVLRALLASALGELGAWERLRRRQSATDAHEILDII